MAKATTNRQTSNKAGVRSTSKKEDNSRYRFGTQPASRKVAGASGLEGRGQRRQGGAATAKAGKSAALRGMKRST